MLRVIIFFLILVLLFIYILGGAAGFIDYDLFSLFKKDKWTGVFYEKKEEAEFIKSGTFNTSDECLNWAKDMTKKLNLIEGTYRYECGKNCQFSENLSKYKCEAIIK